MIDPWIILDTYDAELRNESLPRVEEVTEVQSPGRGELLCYANPAYAERIVACVNACEGIEDPHRVLVELRALMRDLAYSGRLDDRAKRLLRALDGTFDDK